MLDVTQYSPPTVVGVIGQLIIRYLGLEHEIESYATILPGLLWQLRSDHVYSIQTQSNLLCVYIYVCMYSSNFTSSK
jgi:hypothetical protein